MKKLLVNLALRLKFVLHKLIGIVGLDNFDLDFSSFKNLITTNFDIYINFLALFKFDFKFKSYVCRQDSSFNYLY